MKLSEKQLEFLNTKCIERFGIPFEQFYNCIEQNERLKAELKAKKKELKQLRNKG